MYISHHGREVKGRDVQLRVRQAVRRLKSFPWWEGEAFSRSLEGYLRPDHSCTRHLHLVYVELRYITIGYGRLGNFVWGSRWEWFQNIRWLVSEHKPNVFIRGRRSPRHFRNVRRGAQKQWINLSSINFPLIYKNILNILPVYFYKTESIRRQTSI